MKALPRLALVLALGCALAPGARAEQLQTVLMVSIDALHPTALRPDVAPTLETLKHPGQFTLEGRSVTPPQTLIAHTALLTGLTPEQSGKQDNNWKPGQAQVSHETLLDVAKRQGFDTAYFYAKPKLGYLVSASISQQALARDDGVERVQEFLSQPGPRFVFLHLSGLDDVGPDSGWLSPAYLEELRYIDRSLAPLVAQVRARGAYLMLITSDHAGHERLHGTTHPEDFKLPVLLEASQALPNLLRDGLSITRIKSVVQEAMNLIGEMP